MAAMSLAPQSVSIRCSAGFSLVEVTIALGLAAFAMVSVLGALQSGLTVLRDSLDQVSETNLLREVAALASRSSLSELSQRAGLYGFFDEQGLPIQEAADARFKVELDVQDALLPGQATSSAGARVVLVKITRQPSAPGAANRMTIRPLYVADSGF